MASVSSELHSDDLNSGDSDGSLDKIIGYDDDEKSELSGDPSEKVDNAGDDKAENKAANRREQAKKMS